MINDLWDHDFATMMATSLDFTGKAFPTRYVIVQSEILVPKYCD